MMTCVDRSSSLILSGLLVVLVIDEYLLEDLYVPLLALVLFIVVFIASVFIVRIMSFVLSLFAGRFLQKVLRIQKSRLLVSQDRTTLRDSTQSYEASSRLSESESSNLAHRWYEQDDESEIVDNEHVTESLASRICARLQARHSELENYRLAVRDYLVHSDRLTEVMATELDLWKLNSRLEKQETERESSLQILNLHDLPGERTEKQDVMIASDGNGAYLLNQGFFIDITEEKEKGDVAGVEQEQVSGVLDVGSVGSDSDSDTLVPEDFVERIYVAVDAQREAVEATEDDFEFDDEVFIDDAFDYLEEEYEQAAGHRSDLDPSSPACGYAEIEICNLETEGESGRIYTASVSISDQGTTFSSGSVDESNCELHVSNASLQLNWDNDDDEEELFEYTVEAVERYGDPVQEEGILTEQHFTVALVGDVTESEVSLDVGEEESSGREHVQESPLQSLLKDGDVQPALKTAIMDNFKQAALSYARTNGGRVHMVGMHDDAYFDTCVFHPEQMS